MLPSLQEHCSNRRGVWFKEGWVSGPSPKSRRGPSGLASGLHAARPAVSRPAGGGDALVHAKAEESQTLGAD